MKKIKNLLLVLLITSLLFILTGCGNSNDPLTVKRENGDYTEICIIEFSGGKATRIETTMVFINEESAQSMYLNVTELSKQEQNSNMMIQKNDNTIIITNTMDSYATHIGLNADKLGRDDVKTYFDTNGYEVK